MTSTTTTYNFGIPEAKQLSTKALAAVQAALADEGLTIQLGRTTCGDELKISILVTKVALNDDGVNVASPEAAAHERYASTFGIRADALGVDFTANGRTFTYVGLLPRNRKMPIAATSGGKTYKFPDLINGVYGHPSPVVDRINAAAKARRGEG